MSKQKKSLFFANIIIPVKKLATTIYTCGIDRCSKQDIHVREHRHIVLPEAPTSSLSSDDVEPPDNSSSPESSISLSSSSVPY